MNATFAIDHATYLVSKPALGWIPGPSMEYTTTPCRLDRGVFGGEDVFVHISAVERAGLEGLAEGQQLEFTLVDRGGKVSASDLKVVGDVIPVAKREAPPQRELTGERSTGTVKFFNAMKGFGFITRDDGQPDAFVHISAVERSGLRELNEGDKLEFDLEVDRRGKHSAVNLVPIQG